MTLAEIKSKIQEIIGHPINGGKKLTGSMWEYERLTPKKIKGMDYFKITFEAQMTVKSFLKSYGLHSFVSEYSIDIKIYSK